jgi:DNA-binding LacI/PurR family transcriptional regulator
MSSPTIYDIAARAGVGIATVSRVINGSRRVSEHTRQEVQAAMAELGFRPNNAARRLAAGAPTRPRVAALMPFFTSTFYFTVCKALSNELSQLGVDFLLVNVRDSEDADRQLDRLAAERSCEGVIICSMDISEARKDQLQTVGIPIVALDAATGAVPHGRIDNVEGGRLLSRILTEGGARHQALLIGSRNGEVFREREQGFLDACPKKSRVFETDSLDVEGGTAIVRYLLDHFPEVDGIACACDSLAVGVLQELRELGRNVPGEIQVVGFDDQPMMDLLGLTTVRQPMQAFGAWAARSVVELIQKPHLTLESRYFPLELVRRQTTRPASETLGTVAISASSPAASGSGAAYS